MVFDGFGGFGCFFLCSWFWWFLVGPLGHPLPFSIDFHHIPHGSPSVPATNSFKSHQIPHSFIELPNVMSFEFPSDFPQFPESAPCHFPVNSIMFSEVSRRGPLPFFLSIPSDHPRPPWGIQSEALDAGYFSSSEHLLPALQSSIIFSSPHACRTTGVSATFFEIKSRDV